MDKCFIFLIICLAVSAKQRKHRNGNRFRQQIQNVDATQPYSGQKIRLSPNDTSGLYNEGVLEVYAEGSWGLLCEEDWNDNAADVACRQLGFLGTERPYYRKPPDATQWNNGTVKFVMNNVKCLGTEDSITGCPHTKGTAYCTDLSQAVTVRCQQHSQNECGESVSGTWIPGKKSCYLLQEFTKGTKFNKIRNLCASQNSHSHLAIIEDQEEHSFVSNILSRHRSDIDRVILGSKLRNKKGYAWKWQKYTKKGKKLNKKNVKMTYTKWFQGWIPDQFGAEPSVVKGKYKCLGLSHKFPRRDRGSSTVDFYYFDSGRCKPSKNERVFYLCETPTKPYYPYSDSKKTVRECYRGNGEDYRGTASVTNVGSSCIKWTMSERANPTTHPGKGLGDHNFCRNPDGDTKPWCWVKEGTNDFGYCDLPVCTKEPVTTAPTTTTATPNICPDDEFYCSSSDQCISASFRCDNEVDCTGGEDEKECDYKIPLFTMKPLRSIQTGVKERYVTIALEYCARLCLQTTTYICRSISYKADQRECLLSMDNSQITWPSFSFQYDYYELNSQKDLDCTGDYKCENNRCVPLDKVCDDIDDCLDFSDEDGCTETPEETELDVRLVDGDDSYSGRVEIKYRGEWGVICDDQWDIKDASVVCRMLGYSQAEAALHRSKYGSGNGNILLDELDCYGNETSLMSCPGNPWKEHDCKDYEIAGVHCQQIKGCNPNEFTCVDRSCIPQSMVCDGRDQCLDSSDESDCVLKIELVNGTDSEGRVEVILNGVRGTICDDKWDDDAATVVCRSLGFGSGVAKADSMYGRGTGMIWLDEVICDGTEVTLEDCHHQPWGKHDCDHSEDAGVICSNDRPNVVITTTEKPALELTVTLDGSNEMKGRVIVYVNGEKGSICDDDFDDKDATVLCRMMGFYGGHVLENTVSDYGQGTGRIWFDDLHCNGTETSIDQCPHTTDHDCTHEEDAGVVCHEMPKPGVHVELVGGDSLSEGRLEVTINGTVGGMCVKDLTQNKADIICKMLGFSGHEMIIPMASSYKRWISGIYCLAGDEVSLDECVTSFGITPWWKSTCDQKNTAGLKCLVAMTTTVPTLTSSQVSPGVCDRNKVQSCLDDLTQQQGLDIISQCQAFFDFTKCVDSDNIRADCNNEPIMHSILMMERTIGSVCSGYTGTDTTGCSGMHQCLSHIEQLVSDDLRFPSSTDLTTACSKIQEFHACIKPIEAACDADNTEESLNISNNLFGVSKLAGYICDNKDKFLKYNTECFERPELKDTFKACTSPEPQEENCKQISELFICVKEKTQKPCSEETLNFITDTHREMFDITRGIHSCSVSGIFVKLIGGSFEGEGRIEVSKDYDTGSVCDDYWDYKDATVVCRMLGYSVGIGVKNGAYGPGTGPILLDNVQCTGSEVNIQDCIHMGWGNSNCGHDEDAGVVCGREPKSSKAVISLMDGPADNEGRVEIVYGGVRGTLCGDGFDGTKATVVCRMLGYNTGVVEPEGTFSPGTGMIWAAEKWACLGMEDNVEDCENFPGVNTKCTHTQDVGVRCYDETTTSTTTTTRKPTTENLGTGIRIELVNGNVPHRGRVEIIRNGVRGTVCDDKWDDNDATVICRMMGYKRGGTAVSEAVYGAGKGDIVLDDVECSGSEESIEDCIHLGWGVSNCHHGEDAGVRCKVDSGPSVTGDWHLTFSPECGRRPMEETHIRKKRDTPVLGGATVRERPQPAKIVYGTTAEYGMYPWQVGVRQVDLYDYVTGRRYTSAWCGGTILNEHWILSAAHCFDGLSKSDIAIRIGDHNNRQVDKYEQEFEVEAILMHENYDDTTYDYDLALLKISSDEGTGIQFNDYVQPACLPSMDTVYRAGILCHISGWGKTEHGVNPYVLRKEKVPIMNDKKCRSMYKPGAITSHMLCAGYEEGGVDTCQGDSGGPLVCHVDGKYTVLGATSWGNGCGDAASPGVYAHIRNLLPWIIDQIKKYN